MNLVKPLLLFIYLLAFLSVKGAMVLEYDITEANGKEIVLPLNGDEVKVKVDWGDGTTEKVTSAGLVHHTYENTGLKTVRIKGVLNHFGFTQEQIESLKLNKIGRYQINLRSVKKWGLKNLNSLSGAFYSATELANVPKVLPKKVTDLSKMFYRASSFNQPLNEWDVSNVTNMSCLLYTSDAADD